MIHSNQNHCHSVYIYFLEISAAAICIFSLVPYSYELERTASTMNWTWVSASLQVLYQLSYQGSPCHSPWGCRRVRKDWATEYACTGEKPNEEVHRRTGRVPSAEAAMPAGVGYINLLVCLQLHLCTDAAVCKSCHFRCRVTASQNHPHLHHPLSKPSCHSAVLLRVAPSSQASAWPSFNVDDYRLQLLWK